MGITSGIAGRLAALATLVCFTLPAVPAPALINNLTGLPTYPHLDKAAMDDRWHTESLGRWCARFTGVTSDSLDAVADWYRRSLRQASEIDLARDRRFNAYPTLSGIKLVVGTDYVALYRMPNQPTVIELHRCAGSR
ncbi:MAG TPA: hypothetical protein VHY75_16760 [Steroidobacteraceae bacterium]|jgi:hypothetical protein|nr:hypothetical protein [Steroidobacteraceae bacterium]